jgi:hypothetical protein
MANQLKTKDQVTDSESGNTDIHILRLQYRELFASLNLHQKFNVEAEKKGNWFVLKGQVDCQRTKLELFRIVPQVDGARWIVDHVQILGPTQINPLLESQDNEKETSSIRY